MDKLKDERDGLTTQKYNILIKLEHTNDKKAEKRIVDMRKELNQLKEEQTKAKLEILDVEEVLKKLSSELQKLKENLAAKKVLQNIPVSICPICFAELTENELKEGLCPSCKEHNDSEILESLALYKKMIEDSLKEAILIKKDNDEILKDISTQINNKEKKLRKMQEKYFNDLVEMKEPLELLIQELKEQIDVIVERYYKLADLKKIMIESNKLKSQKERLALEIQELHDQLEEASKKTANEILVLEKWKMLYQELFQNIYSKAYNLSISNEDYMPIINGNPMNRISSESMKLVARLSYILSLFNLQTKLDDEKVNPVGFAIFDSPKDKDLDNDKYLAFLKELANTKDGQIFLTGSVLEKDIYESVFDDGDFFEPLTEESRLLKAN